MIDSYELCQWSIHLSFVRVIASVKHLFITRHNTSIQYDSPLPHYLYPGLYQIRFKCEYYPSIIKRVCNGWVWGVLHWALTAPLKSSLIIVYCSAQVAASRMHTNASSFQIHWATFWRFVIFIFTKPERGSTSVSPFYYAQHRER